MKQRYLFRASLFLWLTLLTPFDIPGAARLEAEDLHPNAGPSSLDPASSAVPQGQGLSSIVATPQSEPRISTMSWWSIPRRGRVTLRRMAAQHKATVSRCLMVEQDDQITYLIQARRRVGLFQWEEFELTTYSEPARAYHFRSESTSDGLLERFRSRWSKQ